MNPGHLKARSTNQKQSSKLCSKCQERNWALAEGSGRSFPPESTLAGRDRKCEGEGLGGPRPEWAESAARAHGEALGARKEKGPWGAAGGSGEEAARKWRGRCPDGIPAIPGADAVLSAAVGPAESSRAGGERALSRTGANGNRLALGAGC